MTKAESWKEVPESPPTVSVQTLYEGCRESLGLRLLAGARGLGRSISSPRIQKLGLALSGYTRYLHRGRVQFLGGTEMEFWKTLSSGRRKEALGALFERELCCIVVTRNLKPPAGLVRQCARRGVPLLGTEALSSVAISEVTRFLEKALAPQITLHGVLVDVYGQGVLLLGSSGVGKSECALDLILRGHRLVSDDLVVIRKEAPDQLVGSGPQQLQFHMELRGLGIMNVKELFGISAVTPSQRIRLLIELVPWSPGEEYDRLGLDQQAETLLGVRIPRLTMPVASGRNLATLVEVAVRLQMLRQQGFQPARRFLDEVDRRLKEAGDEGGRGRRKGNS